MHSTNSNMPRKRFTPVEFRNRFRFCFTELEFEQNSYLKSAAYTRTRSARVSVWRPLRLVKDND